MQQCLMQIDFIEAISKERIIFSFHWIDFDWKLVIAITYYYLFTWILWFFRGYLVFEVDLIGVRIKIIGDMGRKSREFGLIDELLVNGGWCWSFRMDLGGNYWDFNTYCLYWGGQLKGCQLGFFIVIAIDLIKTFGVWPIFLEISLTIISLQTDRLLNNSIVTPSSICGSLFEQLDPITSQLSNNDYPKSFNKLFIIISIILIFD